MTSEDFLLWMLSIARPEQINVLVYLPQKENALLEVLIAKALDQSREPLPPHLECWYKQVIEESQDGAGEEWKCQ